VHGFHFVWVLGFWIQIWIWIQIVLTWGKELGRRRKTQTRSQEAHQLNPAQTAKPNLVSQSTSLWRPAQLWRVFIIFCTSLPLYQTFVINIINNIRIRFIISFYVICAVIYCSFYCIYMWLDPGTYMIARFMSFYKPGVTECYRVVSKPYRL